jgi:site-specific recombinase XerD
MSNQEYNNLNPLVITICPPFLSEEILVTKAKEFAKFAFAPNTLVSYKSDWKLFNLWCQNQSFSPLPATIDTLILYISELATQNYKSSSIQRKISAIKKMHNMANQFLNLEDSNFLLVWTCIKRKLGVQKKGKLPILIKTLRDVVATIDTSRIMGIRDKALLTFGWASAMRRSEIIALNRNDIEFIEEGILVNISKSKTDQYGEGQKIAIHYGKYEATCPVRNLQKWQALSLSKEAVFTAVNKTDIPTNNRLSAIDVARIIKKLLLNTGIDPTNFAGHSLRSGFITTAAKHSVPDRIIMKHSRHKSVQMIQVYTRDNSIIQDNATTMVGL